MTMILFYKWGYLDSDGLSNALIIGHILVSSPHPETIQEATNGGPIRTKDAPSPRKFQEMSEHCVRRSCGSHHLENHRVLCARIWDKNQIFIPYYMLYILYYKVKTRKSLEKSHFIFKMCAANRESLIREAGTGTGVFCTS